MEPPSCEGCPLCDVRRPGAGEGETKLKDLKLQIAAEIPHLRRYALTLADSPEAADDLVQDTLERALRKRHLWRRRGRLRGWLFRMLYNVFLNQALHRRRASREAPLDEMTDPPAQPARQDDQVAVREITEAMRQLPLEHRAPILLTAVEGLSYEEAADVLDVPVGTVRSRVSRGREKLLRLHDPRPAASHLRRVK